MKSVFFSKFVLRLDINRGGKSVWNVWRTVVPNEVKRWCWKGIAWLELADITNFGKTGMTPPAAVILMALLFCCIIPIMKCHVHKFVGAVWKNKASATTVAAEQSVLCPTSYQDEVLMYQTDQQSLKQEFYFEKVRFWDCWAHWYLSLSHFIGWEGRIDCWNQRIPFRQHHTCNSFNELCMDEIKLVFSCRLHPFWDYVGPCKREQLIIEWNKIV